MLLNSDIFFTSLFLFSFLFFSLVSLNFYLLYLFFSVDQLLHISLFVFYCQSLAVFFSWNSKRLGCWICYITEKAKQREIPSHDCIFILYQIQIILFAKSPVKVAMFFLRKDSVSDLIFWIQFSNCCFSCLLSIYISFASYSVPICNPILSIIKCIHNIKQAIFVVS
jgi:hypothetical protein